MTAFSRPALSRFLLLYAALYAGFGVQSPYLPSLLDSRDLRPEAIALVLAAGSAVRLVAGPAARPPARWVQARTGAGRRQRSALGGGPSGRPPGRLARCSQGHPSRLLGRGGVDRAGLSADA